MKRREILAVINGLIWGGLVVLGLKLIYGVAGQHVRGYPNQGQLTYYVYFPVAMLGAAVVGFLLSRRGKLLRSVLVMQVGVFLLFFAYMLPYAGGM